MKGKNKQKREWKRAGYTDKHHILNESQGGKKEPHNIIYLDRARHEAWHFLFGNLTFLQASELLIRADRIKKGA